MFLFDTCRSYLAGVRGSSSGESVVLDDGRRVGTRDLNPMAGFTQNMSGSVFVLRSCSTGELSLELPDEASGGVNGNGLFTKALLAGLRRRFEDNQAVSLNEDFYRTLLDDMLNIKNAYHRNWVQTPEFACAGKTLCLWEPVGWAPPPKVAKKGADDPKTGQRSQEKLLEDTKEHGERTHAPDPSVEEEALDEAIRHLQFLCGSATVDLSRNRDDAEMRERLGGVRMTFYNLDRTNKRGKRSKARYADSELALMVKACSDLDVFLQERVDDGRPVFLARECRSSVSVYARKLLGSRYEALAELMLKCVLNPEDMRG